MQQEGMGRRFSQKDVRRDMRDQMFEAADQAAKRRFSRRRRDMMRRNELIETDRDYKWVTGRRIDNYVYESGIKETELFPEGKRILNIGDPWQVIDKKGVVNIEYEMGGVAQFTYDKDSFKDSAVWRYFLDDVKRYLKYFSQFKCDELDHNDITYLIVLISEIADFDFHQSNISSNEYQKQISSIKKAVDILNKIPKDYFITVYEECENKEDKIDYRFYPVRFVQNLKRLIAPFEDLHYVETVIKPAMARKAALEPNFTKEKKEALIKDLVEEFRGQKTYKHAELIKGAFLDVDLEEDSFDRVVASWSITVHMFGAIYERDDFMIIWDELDRILKDDGAAYLWPLDYSQPHDNLIRSLLDYQHSGGTVGIVITDDAKEVSKVVWLTELPNYKKNMRYTEDEMLKLYYDFINPDVTLIILPREAAKETRRRIEQAVVNYAQFNAEQKK